MRALLPFITIVLLLGCSDDDFSLATSETNIENDQVVTNDYTTIKTAKYDRYIFIKGRSTAFSPENVLSEYGQLPAKGNSYEYIFKRTTYRDWIVIKIPDEMASDYYTYHNIVYWFLGSGEEDTNGVAEIISLSLGSVSGSSYFVYNDYKLRAEIEMLNPFKDDGIENIVSDSLFGVFEKKEKFILNIPFETYKETNDPRLKSFETLQSYTINKFDDLESNLDWVEFEILFNERVH